MAKVTVSFRIEEPVLERARQRAGGGEALAGVVRRMVAAYASEGQDPPEHDEVLHEVRRALRHALEMAEEL